MIKINLIDLDMLIKDPLDKLSDSIISNPSKKIILLGGRGIGKTAVLQNHQQRSVDTSSPSILVRFDSAGMFGDKRENQPYYDDSFITHFYELIMSRKILMFIKEKYPDLFKERFSRDEKKLEKLLDVVDLYIREHLYSPCVIDKKLHVGDISEDYIKRFKSYTGIERLSLMIDRFDWTDNSSIIAQRTISEYFNLFDKTIITTDDETLSSDSRREELQTKGFSFVEPVYGSNPDIIKQIILLRLANSVPRYQNSLPLPASLMTSEAMQKLVSETNGNITLALKTIADIENLWEFRAFRPDKEGFESTLELSIERQKIIERESSFLWNNKRLH